MLRAIHEILRLHRVDGLLIPSPASHGRFRPAAYRALQGGLVHLFNWSIFHDRSVLLLTLLGYA